MQPALIDRRGNKRSDASCSVPKKHNPTSTSTLDVSRVHMSLQSSIPRPAAILTFGFIGD